MKMEPGSPEWKARRAQILTDESGKPLRWFYLSFADDDRFHGAVIVEAPGEAHALQRTHQLGINPGGQVAIVAVPDGAPVPDAAKNRLLSKADIEALLGPAKAAPVGGGISCQTIGRTPEWREKLGYFPPSTGWKL